ncbi:GerAB/ArcD/ProY family transporter [Chryseomicrobium palamuruense]|uniref:GerAB/ArcD/ProY family transporter n=1 Tax=Chryseomicrobium palamuruense TaxID=682973 RepID=A0ABV8USU6_9BACL
MKNTLHISPKETINAFLLFFVIHTNQVAVGIHGFQRLIFEDAKHDAWISVILAGLLTHIVAVFMLKTLEIYGTQDLYGIHLDLFGQWIGNFINALYVLYCSAAFFTILQNYIEVIQTWVFHDLNFKFIAASILLLVCYAFLGGIRVIIGVTFFSFVFAIWLFPMLSFPLQYTEFRDVLPFLENDFLDILKGVHSMTLTIVGFEILNIIYPYVKEKKKVSKFLHLGLLVTTLMYLSVMLVSITFFSEGQLNKTIWATLSLFGVLKLPFIERTELIAVCYWLLIILPNLCLYLWAAHRGITRIVKVSASKFAWAFISTIFIGCILVESRTQINSLNTYFSQVAFYIVFVYPIFLFLIALIKKKFTAKRRNLNEEG